jgi:multimeric flavodoxin WrbA
MKTVVLFGSPRKDGSTRRLTDAFTETVTKRQGEVKLLFLNDMNIRPCQGCFSCAGQGVCRINDDMKEVAAAVMKADVVVYATPIYWSGPSGQLKLVIDRSIAFLDKEYRSRVKGKKAITLVSCADDDLGTALPALDAFTRIFEGLAMEYAGHVEAAGCTDKGQVAQAALDAVERLAESLL